MVMPSLPGICNGLVLSFQLHVCHAFDVIIPFQRYLLWADCKHVFSPENQRRATEAPQRVRTTGHQAGNATAQTVSHSGISHCGNTHQGCGSGELLCDFAPYASHLEMFMCLWKVFSLCPILSSVCCGHHDIVRVQLKSSQKISKQLPNVISRRIAERCSAFHYSLFSSITVNMLKFSFGSFSVSPKIIK